MRWATPLAIAAIAAVGYGLRARHTPVPAPPPSPAAVAAPSAATAAPPLHAINSNFTNRAPYIPPQCFTKTLDPGDPKAKNPCYVCHTRSEEPNFTNDQDLQLTLTLPAPLAKNPWTNLFDPAVSRAPRASDDEILAYVRADNYFDAQGHIALVDALNRASFKGYIPDVRFSFDDAGFDHAADGSYTGWRAFAYYPFPGTFFPTNGSADDVLIRLAAPFREKAEGVFDRDVYVVNLAIVEALLKRADVAIDPVDEKALGVDLDLDGTLSKASRVAFDPGRMHYVGRARGAQDAGTELLGAGLFPAKTEFFHTVRYLDVGTDGNVTMGRRMKEARYAIKANWISPTLGHVFANKEAREQKVSRDGLHRVSLQGDRGVYLKNGWFFQGFIEARDGALRPQSPEETAFCEGCHGEIGATADATFAFARKLSSGASARGWFHWSQHGMGGLPEPRRADGEYEYTRYLTETGAGDELRENDEVIRRFFDDAHALRPDAVARLHRDVTYLLSPSPARALDLDRAYRAVVLEQSFDRGRDAVLAPVHNAFDKAPVGARTGIETPVTAVALHLAP